MTASSFEPALNAGVVPARPYRLRPADPYELAQPLSSSVLCAVRYGAADSLLADSRLLTVPLAPLHGDRAGEIWESPLPVSHGRDGLVDHAENGEVMMLHLALPESDMAATDRATERLYMELARYSAARGYPHLLRVWNYISGINTGPGENERYRRFCLGRHRVLDSGPGFERRLPAASAIGTQGGGLTVLALASRRPGTQIENPRQLSAFRYPRAYGPRSPSFSRAMLASWRDGPHLLVSGTASIIGHATAHAGDPIAQLRQTAANLTTLVTQPGLLPYGETAFVPELYTLYLRHADDLHAILPLLPEYFGDASLQVLVGDICRPELLLEVEASYRVKAAAGR